MRKQMTAVLAVAVLIPLVQAAPASAAPGNRAERYSIEECDASSCSTARGVRKRFETPSGNVHRFQNGTGVLREGSFTQAGRTRYKQLIKNGQVQVETFHERVIVTFEGVTCRLDLSTVVIKGELKHEKMTDSCEY